jgi:hypothetical protein
MERQAAFLHALHYGIFPCARGTRDDDEQRLGVMDIEFRMRGGEHARILPEATLRAPPSQPEVVSVK